jgi:hypothetical protein
LIGRVNKQPRLLKNLRDRTAGTHSGSIWVNYGNGSAKGKVGVVFDFAKLRAAINRVLEPSNAALFYYGRQYDQIFSVNYGMVEYVGTGTRRTRRAFPTQSSTPIEGPGTVLRAVCFWLIVASQQQRHRRWRSIAGASESLLTIEGESRPPAIACSSMASI